MNKLILTIVFVFSIFISFCQSYLGWATKQVNFRSGPGTTYEIISTLQAGAQIFIVSDLPENDFYNVIDIATDKEGYLHKSFVKFGDKVDANSEGIFAITGKSTSEQPQLDIYNNTSITMTLKLDNNRYVFRLKRKNQSIIHQGNVHIVPLHRVLFQVLDLNSLKAMVFTHGNFISLQVFDRGIILKIRKRHESYN